MGLFLVAVSAALRLAASESTPPAAPGINGESSGGSDEEARKAWPNYHDELAKYGAWKKVEPHGWVWSPEKIEKGWRPYARGKWEYSRSGWTWNSSEPWGEIVFHYGRWTHDESGKWIWVPDSLWAPAWVAWRDGGDWVGWAPLPAGVKWSSINQDISASPSKLDAIIPAISWNFVSLGSFRGPLTLGRIFPPGRNIDLISQTRNVTRYRAAAGTVFCGGPPADSSHIGAGESPSGSDGNSPTAAGSSGSSYRNSTGIGGTGAVQRFTKNPSGAGTGIKRYSKH